MKTVIAEVTAPALEVPFNAPIYVKTYALYANTNRLKELSEEQKEEALDWLWNEGF